MDEGKKTADSNFVSLEGDEPKEICKLGQGEECCAYLVLGADGFECIRMCYPFNMKIKGRLNNGTMNAKGEGGWPGCAWEKEIQIEKGALRWHNLTMRRLMTKCGT